LFRPRAIIRAEAGSQKRGWGKYSIKSALRVHALAAATRYPGLCYVPRAAVDAFRVVLPTIKATYVFGISAQPSSRDRAPR
jgi:hypothetical protein